ncbi:MAG TPA: hypothetical protein VES67_10550 [Vicinamibacterales bacterium]|nr:hypothetical protein [Vicinamibacterales bacterium]
MPFIRRTRDKRGYDCTYVMHAYRPAQGPHRTRILYVFRSPAGSRIGREPLDDEVQEALEHTHPDLTFDWQALLRESAEPTRGRGPGSRDVPERPSRPMPPRPAPRPREPERPASAPAAPRTAPGVPDVSILGQTLGSETAARLRARYAEVLQRIARRSRSPEERDRLVERARRLNPDDWPDEAGVRAAAVTIEAEWQALVADLPARRRGRRGGRRRAQGRGGALETETALAGEPRAEASGIIEDAGSNGPSDHERPDWPDPSDDAAGDDGGVGAGPAASPADAEPADDVPGDD